MEAKVTEKINEEVYQAVQEFVLTYIEKHKNLRAQKVIDIADDAAIDRIRSIGFSQGGRTVKAVTEDLMNHIFTHQALLQHPRFYAFIPNPASMLSWLGDVMTSAFNPHGGSWMESSAASCIEQEVIKWLCNQVGYPETSGGLFVSGGSMANLTALATARNTILNEKQYPHGVVYVSEQTHSSVAKALRIIGFRTDQIRKIQCDDKFRLLVPHLEHAIKEDLKAGKAPLAVAATAGTTNTGSIDPLDMIADICDKYHLWMHVDGAYGASVLVSKQHRALLTGISRADSISWDAHKWLFQTYSCSMLLVKNQNTLIDSFAANPEYLKDAEAGNGEINFWDLGPELTRPARSLKLWLTLQALGTDEIGKLVERGILLAEHAEKELYKYNGWEIVTQAQLAIINFRFTPAGYTEEQLDSFNSLIAKKMTVDGFATVLTTQLQGKTVLRLCTINPDGTEKDISETIRRLNSHAQHIVEEHRNNHQKHPKTV